MKLQIALTKVSVLACAVFAVMVLSSWSRIGTKAAMPRTCPSCFQSTEMFDVSINEVIKSSVVNTGAQRDITATWKVIDSAGNTVAQSEPQSVSFNKSASFEFLPASAGIRERTALRVELTVEIPDSRDAATNRDEHVLIPTVEVFDRTAGRRSFDEDFFIVRDE